MAEMKAEMKSDKPAVIVEKEGHILIVTLNRPEKRNCVNSEVMCRLYDAWVELDRDPELRVAILTGNGNTFCAAIRCSGSFNTRSFSATRSGEIV